MATKYTLIVIWWLHQMEAFSAFLALCAGNSPITDEFPSQRPVTRSFDVFLDLRLIERLSKRWTRRWFETQSRSLCRHCNETICHKYGHLLRQKKHNVDTILVYAHLCVPIQYCTNTISYKADSSLAPSQWETALLCNDVSHWLGASLESALS